MFKLKQSHFIYLVDSTVKNGDEYISSEILVYIEYLEGEQR